MKRLIRNMKFLIFFIGVAMAQNNRLTLKMDQAKEIINRNIYGHFSEHLGHCIYGGIWVGENSPISNVRGIRKDVVQALQEIKIPVLRWPGGCFADEYHWMDGIGPRNQRATMINTHWGGVTEDNSFGTHEFLDLCEQLGCEPYITGNVGSGTVREMQQWVEYITSDNISPMTDMRKRNGREKPWQVKYWGLGNETWGCGGSMRAEFYRDLVRQYSTYCRNFGGNRLLKIACGANSDDYNWTEVLMQDESTRSMIYGISLHYYTVCHDWQKKGSATQFDEREWFQSMRKTSHMEELVQKHSAVMDRYDQGKKVSLIVDEWGNWHDVEPGTNPGFLYQQNTLRDALVAAVNLNIFNNHCDRVRMANIAQTINVLQAVVLTKEAQMVKTPTFYVYKMFAVHQDATMIPLDLVCQDYALGSERIPSVSASASKDKNGIIHITYANLNPKQNLAMLTELGGLAASVKVSGQIITADAMNAYNDFGLAEAVTIKPFTDVKVKGEQLQVALPAKSVVMVEIRL
jgi:alpha-L-arabinofuranosidase